VIDTLFDYFSKMAQKVANICQFFKIWQKRQIFSYLEALKELKN